MYITKRLCFSNCSGNYRVRFAILFNRVSVGKIKAYGKLYRDKFLLHLTLSTQLSIKVLCHDRHNSQVTGFQDTLTNHQIVILHRYILYETMTKCYQNVFKTLEMTINAM